MAFASCWVGVPPLRTLGQRAYAALDRDQDAFVSTIEALRRRAYVTATQLADHFEVRHRPACSSCRFYKPLPTVRADHEPWASAEVTESEVWWRCPHCGIRWPAGPRREAEF